MDGGLRLYSNDGKRLYLNGPERAAFLAAARRAPDETRLFCWIMAYTGCRISEALSLSAGSFQVDAEVVAFRSLKKRNKIVFREIPLPSDLVADLRDVFRPMFATACDAPLWHLSRVTAWRRVKHIMYLAGIDGPQDKPERPSPRLWNSCRRAGCAGDYVATLARACGSENNGDLCACCRSGRTADSGADVVMPRLLG